MDFILTSQWINPKLQKSFRVGKHVSYDLISDRCQRLCPCNPYKVQTLSHLWQHYLKNKLKATNANLCWCNFTRDDAGRYAICLECNLVNTEVNDLVNAHVHRLRCLPFANIHIASVHGMPQPNGSTIKTALQLNDPCITFFSFFC